MDRKSFLKAGHTPTLLAAFSTSTCLHGVGHARPWACRSPRIWASTTPRRA